MGFVTIKDQDGVEHTIHASQLQAPNQTLTVTYSCPDCDKLRADLAAAQRELAACRKVADEMDNRYPNEWCSTSEVMTARVAELLAQEGVSAQHQYREPTLEDVIELRNCNLWGAPKWLDALKQLGFYRRVQP